MRQARVGCQGEVGSEGVGHGKQAHASLSKTSAVQRAPFPPVTLRPSKACSKAHIANGETKAGGGGKGARPTSQAGSGRAWGAPACEKVHCSRASSLTGVRVPHGVRCAALQERHILRFMFRHITKNNQQAPPFQKNLRVATVYYLKCPLSTFQIARHGKK